MDAHVVRRVFAALTPVLTGARLEKIHHPAPDLYTVTFYAAGHKQHLVLRAGRKLPLLYLSPRRPAAPSTPDAVTMRLRKYLCGKRVVDVVCHWQERRLAMRVASAAQPQIIRGLVGGGKCLMKMGKDVYQISYLPYGMGKMIFWGPFGGFRSGAVYTMKGVIAPGKLVVHTMLFPYVLFGGSLNI